MKKVKNLGKEFSSNRKFAICISVSVFLHLLLLFSFFLQQKMEEIRKNKLLAVEYKEEEKKKEEKKKEPEKEKPPEPPKAPTPQTAIITPKDLFQIQQLKDKIDENMLKKLENIARPMDNQLTDMKIDIDKMLDMNKDQVELDLNAFDADLDLDAPTIRIGKGVSMDDILARDQVMMPLEARALPAQVGLIARPGFSGTGPGEGGIEITNGPAEKLESVSKSLVTTKSENKQIDTKSSGPVQIEISGALADRARIAGTPPPYPVWAQQQGLAAVFSVSLKVDAEGKITGSTIVISPTGYPDWDNGVIKWLKDNWRWVKIPSGETPGCITIRFTIGQ
jgi:outer membrane biosynthesis protein TonB